MLVIHENRGLNDHIRDVTRRLALAGFSGVAPDFLSPAGGTPADEDQARTMIGALDMAQTVDDGVAMIRWLASSEGGSRKVGAVGFCWGGGMVNRLAVGRGRRAQRRRSLLRAGARSVRGRAGTGPDAASSSPVATTG